MLYAITDNGDVRNSESLLPQSTHTELVQSLSFDPLLCGLCHVWSVDELSSLVQSSSPQESVVVGGVTKFLEMPANLAKQDYMDIRVDYNDYMSGGIH